VELFEKAFGIKRRFIHESGYGEMDTGSTALAFTLAPLTFKAETTINSFDSKTLITGAVPAGCCPSRYGRLWAVRPPWCKFLRRRPIFDKFLASLDLLQYTSLTSYTSITSVGG
jgi:hypothetical protein